MARIFAAVVACLLWLSSPAHAQIQNIFVAKTIRYVQTSDTDISLKPRPYIFHAEVRGSGLEHLAAPTLSGPINYGVLGSFTTNGALTYTAPSWYFAPAGSQEWSFDSRSAMDAGFGNGVYNYTVNGTPIALNLSGDAYPNPPHVRLTGGTWASGKYFLDPSKTLTITTDPFTEFNSYVRGFIQIYYRGQLQQLVSGPSAPGNVLAITIPGGTFPPNQESPVNIVFTAIVDNGGGPQVPGATNSAIYWAGSELTVSTQSQAALPPSTQVSLRKVLKYVQTSATSVVDDANNAVFHAGVDGSNISGIAAPTISGPFNVAAIGTEHNGGVLAYNANDRGWRYGAGAHDFTTSSVTQLNNLFPDGTYTFSVNGASVGLKLSGNAYPQPASATLTGGLWSDGAYVIPRDQALTVTTGAFGGYGTHADDAICIWLSGPGFVADDSTISGCPGALQQASTTPGSNTMSYTVPGNTMASGRQYTLNVYSYSVVDTPANANAGYAAHMRIPLKATEPVFPMTVTSNITPTVSSASAQIQFRPQDVGTQGSIYVFAVAPATIVKDALAAKRVAGDPFAHYQWTSTGDKDTAPVQCVLAQLSASGQLVGVSASTLQAYVTGVLSSQGAAITILNGVPTVNIGGATFYVGYGSSAAAMLNGGTNRSALTIPGTNTCQPKPPQTGWWWNPAEGGRGYSVEVQGNHIFFASFLYDPSGRSTWYVATGATSLDGSLFSDALYSARGGQTLGGPYPGFPQLANAGPVVLAFSSESQGSLTWPGGTVPIERFPMVPNGLAMPKAAGAPESGWWWNASESGRGFFMEWQGNTLDLAGYLYDDQGNPIWLLTYLTTSNPSGAVGQTVSGSWWSYGNGQTLIGPYKPAQQLTNSYAPVTIQFTAPDTAIMTLPNGRSTTLTRQLF